MARVLVLTGDAVEELDFEPDCDAYTEKPGHQMKGRATAAFPPLKADVEQAGGTFVDGLDVVDGMMVSCRGRPDLPEWSRAFMRLLEKVGSA